LPEGCCGWLSIQLLASQREPKKPPSWTQVVPQTRAGRVGCPTSFNRLTVAWYLKRARGGVRPNVKPDGFYDFYALRDIAPGEELIADFRQVNERLFPGSTLRLLRAPVRPHAGLASPTQPGSPRPRHCVFWSSQPRPDGIRSRWARKWQGGSAVSAKPPESQTARPSKRLRKQ